jgi:DNA-binding HxlR family transcriptional regulator
VTGPDFCPTFQRAVELIGRRWSGAIARALLPGPLYFADLERAIPDISARALSQRLKELEAEGIVIRRVEAGTPVRVRYELTEKGCALEDVVERVEAWAHEWLEEKSPRRPAHAGA